MVEIKPIIELINKKMRIEQEDEVMRAVASVGVRVDKERLVRAIEYARSFWMEGYNEGVNAGRPHGRWERSDMQHEKFTCSVCGGASWYYDFEGLVVRSRYCPNCGAPMDLEEK